MWKVLPLRHLTHAVLNIKRKRYDKKAALMGSVRVRPFENAYRLDKN